MTVAAEAIIVAIEDRRKNWRPLAGSSELMGLRRHTQLLYHSYVDASQREPSCTPIWLVEHYSKSTAAQLSASEIKEDLSIFCLDNTWKQTSLMFLNLWATHILDLDLALVEACTESQKRIWFI